jgi:hypothetical protein
MVNRLLSTFRAVAMFALPVAVGLGQAINDECSTAIAVASGLTSGTNTQATTSSGVPSGCAASGADVWYHYTPATSGTVMVSMCPLDGGMATFDSVLRAFSGTCGALSIVACNNDVCGQRSRVAFSASGGTTYLIAVSGFAGATGSFTMNVSLGSPSNDECSNAIPVGQGLTAGTTIGATTSPGVYQSCGQTAEDVWFSYTPTASGVQTFSLNAMHGGSVDFHAVLRIFPSACGNLGGEGYCVGGGFPPYWTGAFYTNFPVNAGQTYMIEVAVGLPFGSPGSFILSIPPPPVNDTCAGAIPLQGGLNGPFSNFTATNGPGGPCQSGAKDLWFSYTASTAGTASVDTCGLAFYATSLVVYGSCGGSAITCNNDYCNAVYARVTFPVSAGATYYIRYSATCPSPTHVYPPDQCQFHLMVSPDFTLEFTSTGLPGNVTVVHSHGIPGSLYFTGVSFNWAGSFPNGWFFGVDIPGDQLQFEINLGAPFVGQLDPSGGRVYTTTVPALSGTPIYAVTVALGASLVPVDSTAPVQFVIP